MSNKCLLCKTNDAYRIKSHMTPNGITENTYGERNKETIFTVDAQEKSIEKYYGREVSQTEITEIKDAPNVRRDVFCKRCEENFGKYESIVQNRLNDTINSLGKGAGISKSSNGIKYISIDIPPNILITYFQSIVWRQCVEQLLDGKDSPLGEKQLEDLRLIVLNNTSLSPKEIVQKDLSTNPKLSIITTYHTKHPHSPSFANPNIADTNPLVFFIGPVVLLYWLASIISQNFETRTYISEGFLVSELLLDKGKISILNEGVWSKVHRQFAQSIARQYNQS